MNMIAGQQRTSRDTCVNTLCAVAKLVDSKEPGGWKPGSYNLDIGCGKYHRLHDYLLERGVNDFRYDPYAQTDEENSRAFGNDKLCSYDTVTCSNVLNVIDDYEAMMYCINNAFMLLKEGGKAYFTVYEGDKTGVGKETKSDCWQRNDKTAEYVYDVGLAFGEENVARKGKLIIAIKRKDHS